MGSNNPRRQNLHKLSLFGETVEECVVLVPLVTWWWMWWVKQRDTDRRLFSSQTYHHRLTSEVAQLERRLYTQVQSVCQWCWCICRILDLENGQNRAAVTYLCNLKEKSLWKTTSCFVYSLLRNVLLCFLLTLTSSSTFWMFGCYDIHGMSYQCPLWHHKAQPAREKLTK